MMVTVGIMGILATIAIPTFYKYKHRIRFSEAEQNLSQLFKGEAALYNSDFRSLGGLTYLGSHAYGSCAIYPTLVPTEEPYAPTYNCPYLHFAPTDPLYYYYMASPQSSGLTQDWDYLNFAWEDLDGDGEIATYVEAIGSRDGQLYRAGRFSNGDQSTIVLGWSAALATMPAQSGGPGN